MWWTVSLSGRYSGEWSDGTLNYLSDPAADDRTGSWNRCGHQYRDGVYLGIGKKKRSDDTAGIGTPLALVMWVLFAGVCFFLMPAYARMNTSSEEVITMVVSYGRIVCVLSIGLFLESVWTKVHQAEGNMRVPMIAQIVGAVVNIVLDPFLIFGLCGLPKMGIAGAATATVVGQIAAAVIVMKGGCRKIPKLVVFPHQIKRIYKLGIPNILMQSAYTFYIFGLNLLLATFSDQAVTVLGLYYKWQAFFFIPLGAMQTCIVPVVSYNFAAGKYERCKKTLKVAIGFGVALMMIGVVLFETIPGQMLHVFSHDPEVIRIGVVAFRFIGISFVPLVSSLTFPVFFQALGHAATSSILTIIRTVLFIYSTGLSVFEIRTELVLADISGDGFHHDTGRIPDFTGSSTKACHQLLWKRDEVAEKMVMGFWYYGIKDERRTGSVIVWQKGLELYQIRITFCGRRYWKS